MSMAALSKKGVQPEKLPPTEDAAKYHAFRVHLQVMQWMGIEICETEWGWKRKEVYWFQL